MKRVTTTVTTHAGVEVQVGQSQLVLVSIMKDGAAQKPEFAAAFDVPDELLAAARSLGGSLTMTSVVLSDDTAAGVVLVRGLETIAALVFDAAAPALESWLAVGRARGYLPLALRSGTAVKVVHAGLQADFTETIRQSPSLRCMNMRDLVDVTAMLIRELDDEGVLSRMGLARGVLRQASLAVLLPVDDAMTASGPEHRSVSYH